MNRAERKAPPVGRRAEPGNALLEFILTLPIIIFVTGLTIYMSMAMLTKQQALVGARHHLWHAAGHGGWAPMKLEGWQPAAESGEDWGYRPRGTGEELDRLLDDVEDQTLKGTSDPKARDFWDRLWGNLPGRHETHDSRSFQTQGSLWNFINRTAKADHYRDSSPWHFYHLDVWRIARSGPLRVVFESFRDNLEGEVADHFKPVRDDIIRRWWHGSDVLEQEPEGG